MGGLRGRRGGWGFWFWRERLVGSMTAFERAMGGGKWKGKEEGGGRLGDVCWDDADAGDVGVPGCLNGDRIGCSPSADLNS